MTWTRSRDLSMHAYWFTRLVVSLFSVVYGKRDVNRVYYLKYICKSYLWRKYVVQESIGQVWQCETGCDNIILWEATAYLGPRHCIKCTSIMFSCTCATGRDAVWRDQCRYPMLTYIRINWDKYCFAYTRCIIHWLEVFSVRSPHHSPLWNEINTCTTMVLVYQIP